MKIVYVAIISMILILVSGCGEKGEISSSIDAVTESTLATEPDSKSEVLGIIDEPSQDNPNTDIFFELDLEDGKFYEIPRLSEEKEAAFIQSDNCAESIRARLESYGVFLNPDVITEDMTFSDVKYSFLPMFISHYKDFDVLYVLYAGYRSYLSGDLYIFKNSMLEKYISNIGAIDLENCFREIEGNIWLVKIKPSGGSGMAMEVNEWINLTKDDMPTELYYTNYFGSSNYRFGYDIDFTPIMIYNALEEELYINEKSIPMLKVSWQKEVYVEKEPSGEGKIISLIATGYDEYAIDTPMGWEDFDPSDLSCGELLNGLEEQLNELIRSGTEEEKHIAKQLVDNFATMPNS